MNDPDLDNDPDAPPDILATMNDLDRARSRFTPPDVLNRLSSHTNWSVRVKVANNPSTPVEILNRLLQDHWVVRQGIADNPSTPAEILIKLAQDDHCLVVLAVVNNPNCPEWVKVMIG
jgi:Leucine rich repeat variant